MSTMPNENQAEAHYMKLGAALAYCGRTTQNVKLAYDDWAKVTCTDCLAHPAAPTAFVPASATTH